MARSSKIEWLFAVFLVFPIALYLLSKVFGSDKLGEISAYLLLPIAFLFIAAFIANFINTTRRGGKKRLKEQELYMLIDSLVGQPENKLSARRLDGSEITARYSDQGYSVTDKGLTTVMTKAELHREIFTYCTTWSVCSAVE